VNWQKEGNYNWVDLDFMARLFRFSNPQAASLCYLEYVADEEQEDVYPKPATKETFRI
jgi:surfeit locus 1 family protein